MHTQFARTSGLVLMLTGMSACEPDDVDVRSFEAEDASEDEGAREPADGPALGLRDELPEPSEGTERVRPRSVWAVPLRNGVYG